MQHQQSWRIRPGQDRLLGFNTTKRWTRKLSGGMQSVSCSGLLVNCLGTSGRKKLPSSYMHMYFPAFRSAALPRLPLQPCCLLLYVRSSLPRAVSRQSAEEPLVGIHAGYRRLYVQMHVLYPCSLVVGRRLIFFSVAVPVCTLIFPRTPTRCIRSAQTRNRLTLLLLPYTESRFLFTAFHHIRSRHTWARQLRVCRQLRIPRAVVWTVVIQEHRMPV